MSAQNTILVVEDNDFVRTQIVTFLKGAGYATLEATDGDRAFETMGEDVTLAIVDVRMSPMDGFDFLSLIRTEGYKTPVILVTGDQEGDLLTRANQHGASAVLLKPVQKDRLLSTVARLIERGSR